ncbi:hypothetical protein CVT24_009416 [Panaeolus cyanescens]|uniref:GLTSCR protein conserved domain-containing protein n=1 Tax=Panaeolus cyanescens TaxID=181874 RepID=A0A409VER6_9AGAR|nr:hypothetical protein CVT24_009416 [Panaeolus cyanescens]
MALVEENQNNTIDAQRSCPATELENSIQKSTSTVSVSEHINPIWQPLPSSSSTQDGPPEHHDIVGEHRTPEKLASMPRTTDKIKRQTTQDENSVLHPDVDSPFVDQLDAIMRLLPYHLFQQPREDMTRSKKGKERAEDKMLTEIQGKFCLRHEGIRSRWRNLKARVGKRSGADDQSYYLAQVVLESDRSENAWLTSELRSARAECERIEREKRAAANAARMTQFSSIPQPAVSTLQTQYYRPYPYGYTQAYGVAPTGPSISTFPVSNVAPTTYTPYQATSAIPVQLPVASLPALHALGIIPVPAGALPTDGQPQPAAVLKGSSANGTILSLEINVSLLQSAQMSGLAMVLNSLVSRASSSSAPLTTPNQNNNKESSA